uniref:Ig-like domain-containing protein n=1 Tax=Falco tinnunculus TaxID=100819 RepID=A0A8C4TU79_FALTI
GGLRPSGGSVQLSCRGSGFHFGHFGIWWYRQGPSGGLEWVSWISHSSLVIHIGPGVEGRAAVSRDNSQSETYLSLHLIHLGDSARYFCAVFTQRQEIQLSFNTNYPPGSRTVMM